MEIVIFASAVIKEMNAMWKLNTMAIVGIDGKVLLTSTMFMHSTS